MAESRISHAAAASAMLLRRIVRLPRRITPYLAHPVHTVRMTRNADLHRNPYMAQAFLFSRTRIAWRAALIGVAAGGFLAATWRPARRAAALALAAQAIAVVGYRWWNGPRGLARRGLPPGRLMIPLFTPLLDEGHLQRELGRHGSMFTTNSMYSPTVAVGDIELGRRILREHGDALRPPVFSHSADVVGGAIRNQCGDRHRMTRAAFARGFTPSVVEALRPGAVRCVDRHLRGWADDRDDGAGAVRRRTDRLSLDASIRAFFGVSPESGSEAHSRLTSLLTTMTTDDDRIERPVLGEITSAVTGLASRPMHLEPSALRALATDAPESLDDPVVVSNLIHTLHVTRQDMAALFTWITNLLAHHPEWCERVRAGASGDGPASWVVSETLRLAQSEHLIRETTRPITVEGYRIPAGWWVQILIRQSHRDGSKFDDPERFAPCRFAHGRPPRAHYAPFGLDAHHCVGESYVRSLAAAFVAGLASYDLVLLGDGPIRFENYHWAPSGEFRVRLDPHPS